MAAAVLETRALVRRFGIAPVLAGIDVHARRGEIVVVFGPNGAGKTTLIRILGTLLRPTSGIVQLFGEDAFGASAAALRRRLGLLTHETFLYPDLTAMENLHFYARLYGLGDQGARVDELLTWAGLGQHRDRPVRAYSKGMGQRLALARALLHRPELLLLDEPFSGLDAGAATAVEEALVRLRGEGGTALFTTHDVDRGIRLADRAYILERGRIAWASTGPAGPEAFDDAYRRIVQRR